MSSSTLRVECDWQRTSKRRVRPTHHLKSMIYNGVQSFSFGTLPKAEALDSNVHQSDNKLDDQVFFKPKE